MNTVKIEKSPTDIMVEIIEYEPHAVVSKTIINKISGNISVKTFSNEEGLKQKQSPFNTFAQMIDGSAEIMIEGKSHLLDTGHSIVIPAHKTNIVKANGRFKMIQTVVKTDFI